MSDIRVYETPGYHTITKKPVEQRWYVLNFSRVLKPGETLSGVSVDDGAADVLLSASVTGQYCHVQLGGGADGSSIPIRVVVTGNAGTIAEADLLLAVSDPIDYILPVIETYSGDTVIWYDTVIGAYYRLALEDGALVPVEVADPALGSYKPGESVYWYDSILAKAFKLILENGAIIPVEV
jgi:hypothetical protein